VKSERAAIKTLVVEILDIEIPDIANPPCGRVQAGSVRAAPFAGAFGEVRRSRRIRVFSVHPVAGKFLYNIRVHGLCVVDVHFAVRNGAAALSSQTASVQRRSQARIDSERGVKIGDGVLGQSALEVDEPSAVEGIDEVRAQPKRFVAIPERRLQIADHGARPTSVVIGLDVLRVQSERVVEILDRKAVGALARIDLSAPV
jgi:hypothetical protein